MLLVSASRTSEKNTMAAPPLVHSRQACPGPVCTPRWSAGRGPTSPAGREEQGEAAENPESGVRGKEEKWLPEENQDSRLMIEWESLSFCCRFPGVEYFSED